MRRCARRYKRDALNWLAREYAEILEKWREPSVAPAFPPKPKIELAPKPRVWTLWWQGRDQAPEIVKQCIARMERNCEEIELIVLDSDNIAHYIDVDDEIRKKVDMGVYSLTHLSDYIRLTLLYTYGGLWLDSTIWLNRALTSSLDWIFDPPFYSIRFVSEPSDSFFTGCWTTYILGCHAQSPVAGFVLDVLQNYFRNENLLMDYFLFDFVLELGYRRLRWFRELVDAVPINNVNRDVLSKCMKKGDREGAIRALSDGSQWFYKTTYKADLKFLPDDIASEVNSSEGKWEGCHPEML